MKIPLLAFLCFTACCYALDCSVYYKALEEDHEQLTRDLAQELKSQRRMIETSKEWREKRLAGVWTGLRKTLGRLEPSEQQIVNELKTLEKNEKVLTSNHILRTKQADQERNDRRALVDQLVKAENGSKEYYDLLLQLAEKSSKDGPELEKKIAQLLDEAFSEDIAQAYDHLRAVPPEERQAALQALKLDPKKISAVDGPHIERITQIEKILAEKPPGPSPLRDTLKKISDRLQKAKRLRQVSQLFEHTLPLEFGEKLLTHPTTAGNRNPKRDIFSEKAAQFDGLLLKEGDLTSFVAAQKQYLRFISEQKLNEDQTHLARAYAVATEDVSSNAPIPKSFNPIEQKLLERISDTLPPAERELFNRTAHFVAAGKGKLDSRFLSYVHLLMGPNLKLRNTNLLKIAQLALKPAKNLSEEDMQVLKKIDSQFTSGGIGEAEHQILAAILERAKREDNHLANQIGLLRTPGDVEAERLKKQAEYEGKLKVKPPAFPDYPTNDVQAAQKFAWETIHLKRQENIKVVEGGNGPKIRSLARQTKIPSDGIFHDLDSFSVGEQLFALKHGKRIALSEHEEKLSEAYERTCAQLAKDDYGTLRDIGKVEQNLHRLAEMLDVGGDEIPTKLDPYSTWLDMSLGKAKEVGKAQIRPIIVDIFKKYEERIAKGGKEVQISDRWTFNREERPISDWLSSRNFDNTDKHVKTHEPFVGQGWEDVGTVSKEISKAPGDFDKREFFWKTDGNGSGDGANEFRVAVQKKKGQDVSMEGMAMQTIKGQETWMPVYGLPNGRGGFTLQKEITDEYGRKESVAQNCARCHLWPDGKFRPSPRPGILTPVDADAIRKHFKNFE